jgi:branched-chain amino acid transport system permease protein
MIKIWKRYIVLLVILAVLAFVPAITKNMYYLHVMTQMFIWIVLSSSLLLIIRTGVFNFGHAAFIGIGAYSTGILMVREGINFWLTVPIAGAAAILVALLIGIPILRVKGMYFVLLSACLTEVLKLALANWEYAGGWTGIYGIRAPRLLMIDFHNKVAYYYLAFVFMVVSMLALHRLWTCQIGKIFRAISGNKPLAASIGVPVTRYEIIALCASTFFAALGGSFLAPMLTSIEPMQFGMMTTAQCFLYMVVGGMNSIFGPAIGTVIGIFLDESFRFAKILRPAMFGFFVIIMVIFLREKGIMGLPERLSQIVRRRGSYQGTDKQMRVHQIPKEVESRGQSYDSPKG